METAEAISSGEGARFNGCKCPWRTVWFGTACVVSAGQELAKATWGRKTVDLVTARGDLSAVSRALAARPNAQMGRIIWGRHARAAVALRPLSVLLLWLLQQSSSVAGWLAGLLLGRTSALLPVIIPLTTMTPAAAPMLRLHTAAHLWPNCGPTPHGVGPQLGQRWASQSQTHFADQAT